MLLDNCCKGRSNASLKVLEIEIQRESANAEDIGSGLKVSDLCLGKQLTTN
jgi:hypothetical protein